MYMYLCPPCADPTLTLKNLCLVTASVHNWYNLGWYRGGLGIPQSVRNEIRDNTDYQTEEEKKEALLLYYLHTIPMASWPNVAGALHFRQGVAALQAVKGFLKDIPAGQSSLCYSGHVHIDIMACSYMPCFLPLPPSFSPSFLPPSLPPSRTQSHS